MQDIIGDQELGFQEQLELDFGKHKLATSGQPIQENSKSIELQATRLSQQRVNEHLHEYWNLT